MRGLRTSHVAQFLCLGPLAALFVAGCTAAPATAGTGPSASPAVLASPIASPSPAGSTSSTPVLPQATFDVSPSQAQVGGVVLSLTFEPARRMLPQTAMMTSDPDPSHQPDTGAGPATPASTSLVLDGLLSLSNNLDPSQPTPTDQPQVMIRHVDVQVRSTDGGFSVPYLSASLDLLLDGRPIASGLPVAPMVAGDSSAPQLYYGNNVKLAQRGTYQVFVRLRPNPLTGKDQPQAAQFNVVVH